MSAVYIIDTNIIIHMNDRMPRDVHPGVWEAMEELIAAQRAIMPRMAYDELEGVSDECAPWAKQQPGFIQDANDSQVITVQAISVAHPGWVQERKNAADPWIVACGANTKDAVIVTDERLKGPGVIDSNLKIPNVAVEYGVEYCNFNDLSRREGWTFTRG